MKLCTINPIYTPLFSVLILAALTSSVSIFVFKGKTYINLKYELIYGGNKTLRIGGLPFSSLKSYRKLSADEQLKLQKTKEKNDKKWKEKDEAREKEAISEKKRAQLEKEQKNYAEKLEREKRVPIIPKKRSFNNRQNRLRSRGKGRTIMTKDHDQIIMES